MNYKYQIRGLVAAFILLLLLGMFVRFALIKSIDNQVLEDTRIMEEHWAIWRGEE